MPIKAKIRQVGASSIVTIPCKVMEVLGLQKGDIVLLSINKEGDTP